MRPASPSEPPAPHVSEDALAEIFQSVWGPLTTLGLDRARANPTAGDVWLRGDEGLTGLVHISGAWAGTVVFRCAAALGAKATTAMLGLEGEAPSASDVRDVAGEIANVLGGKVKAALPGPNALSLPTVIEGDRYRVHLPDSRLLGEAWFVSEGLPIVVAVWKKQEDADDDSVCS